jgi:hypothetical protein
MVSQLTAEVLARGYLPFYSTTVSNVRSSQVTLGLDYRLAWVGRYAREP